MDNKAIAARAEELIVKHHNKRAIFEENVRSQLGTAAAAWMLHRFVRNSNISDNK